MKRIMIVGSKAEEEEYKNYLQAFRSLGADPFLSLSLLDMKDADSVVLPGSLHDMNPVLWGEENQHANDVSNELDQIQWDIMKLAIPKKKPVLGICRGIQFINVYFGGTLVQDLPCGEKHKASDPENFHLLHNVKDGFMWELYGETCQVNSRHHQSVNRIGDGLLETAFWLGEDGYRVTETIRHEELPIFGLQWHPERMYLYGNEKQKETAEMLLRFFMKQMHE